MITPEKQREYESRRQPRRTVQLPLEAAKAGKRIAEKDGKTLGQWLAELIESAKKRVK